MEKVYITHKEVDNLALMSEETLSIPEIQANWNTNKARAILEQARVAYAVYLSLLDECTTYLVVAATIKRHHGLSNEGPTT